MYLKRFVYALTSKALITTTEISNFMKPDRDLHTLQQHWTVIANAQNQ